LEKEAFDAIYHCRQEPSAKLLQLLRVRSPSTVELSDTKAKIVAFTSTEVPADIELGTVVRLDKYKFMSQGTLALMLQVDGLHVVGAQGIGLVGEPVDVNQTIQVRRAIDFINHDADTLLLRLQGTFRQEMSVDPKRPLKIATAASYFKYKEALARVLDEEGDLNDDEEEEEEEKNREDKINLECHLQIPETQHFESPQHVTLTRTKKTVRIGNPGALLRDRQKLNHVLQLVGISVDDDDDEDEERPGTQPESEVAEPHRSGEIENAVAMLREDVKSDDDGDEPFTQSEPLSQSLVKAARKELSEYEIPLRDDSQSSASKTRRSKHNASKVSPVPFVKATLGSAEELVEHLAEVAESVHDKLSQDETSNASSTSAPVGISDMLCPPTQDFPPPKPLACKRPLETIRDEHGKKAVRITSPGKSSLLLRHRPGVLTVASPREVSAATEPLSNLSTHIPRVDEEYMNRFRRRKNFFQKVWEQRNREVIKFLG
jgi:hypothetical protein